MQRNVTDKMLAFLKEINTGEYGRVVKNQNVLCFRISLSDFFLNLESSSYLSVAYRSIDGIHGKRLNNSCGCTIKIKYLLHSR